MNSADRFKSSYLKIGLAVEHIDKVNKFLAEERPFRYIVETDAKNGWRSTYAKPNEAVVDRLSLYSSDAVQNLRDAIDHAYYAVVSPFVTDAQKQRVQFPFSKTAEGLESAVCRRYAKKVSSDFFDAIIKLKPHGDLGGNKLLYFMSLINNAAKHASLTPVGYFVEMHVGDVRKYYIPDFLPDLIENSTVGFGQNWIDATWNIKPFTMHDWIVHKVPRSGIIKNEVDIPIDVTFEGRVRGNRMLVAQTLDQFVDVTRNVVGVISKFS